MEGVLAPRWTLPWWGLWPACGWCFVGRSRPAGVRLGPDSIGVALALFGSGVCWPLSVRRSASGWGGGPFAAPCSGPWVPSPSPKAHSVTCFMHVHTTHRQELGIVWSVPGPLLPLGVWCCPLCFFVGVGVAGVSGGIGVRCWCWYLGEPNGAFPYKHTHTHTLQSLHCHRLCAAVAVLSFILCLGVFVFIFIFYFLMVIYLFIYLFLLYYVVPSIVIFVTILYCYIFHVFL